MLPFVCISLALPIITILGALLCTSVDGSLGKFLGFNPSTGDLEDDDVWLKGISNEPGSLELEVRLCLRPRL